MNEFFYGMKLRPFSIGCQPNGWTRVEDGKDGYWNILVYPSRLSDKDIEDYELVYLKAEYIDANVERSVVLSEEEVEYCREQGWLK